MQKSCPISLRKVDERQVRANSILVFIFCLSIIFYDIEFLLWLLLFDFIAKSVDVSFSPLSLAIKRVFLIFDFPKKEIDYAPKKFAAGVGVAIVLCAILFKYSGFESVYIAFIAVVSFCALLESLFAYCVGCKVYEILISLKR